MKDLFTGRMSWRELRVYLDGLPMESALKTELRDQAGEVPAAVEDDGQYGSWSKTELLLASVIDQLGSLTYVQVSRAGVKSQPPSPVYRPGVKAKPKADPRVVTYLDEIRRKNLAAREVG